MLHEGQRGGVGGTQPREYCAWVVCMHVLVGVGTRRGAGRCCNKCTQCRRAQGFVENVSMLSAKDAQDYPGALAEGQSVIFGLPRVHFGKWH